MKRGWLVGLMVAGAGCLTGDRTPAQPPTPPPASTAQRGLADTLVLTTADGYQIWMTDAREAQSLAGETCVERSVEIRRDTARARVPLLYTQTAPRPESPGYIQAELSRDCRTMAIYRVELATARPTKLEDR